MISLIRPIPDATITSGWMEGRIHHGIDFAAPKGTPIHAAADGRVTYAGFNRGSGYGVMVEIQHGSNVATRYAHMSGTNVYVGQTVKQGDVIGYVGSTGDSTGPHCHFELIVNGGKINPEPYLHGQPVKPPGVDQTGGPFSWVPGVDAAKKLYDAVTQFVQWLTKPGLWYRVGLFALGLVVIAGGVYLLYRVLNNKQPIPISRRYVG